MKIAFTLFLVALTLLAFCQPTISPSNIPQVGDQVLIAICSNPVDPGNPGAMQTWDMSGLLESEQQAITYILPSEGLYSDSFPNANLCAKSWLDDYSYYNVSPSSLDVEGHVVTIDPNDTSVFVYDNSEKIVGLPYTYNDAFIDTFNGIFHSPGFGPLAFDGYLDFEADGYGTLILPTGTYTNVVRYHFYREQTSYFIGMPFTTTKNQWAWVSSDYRFWLLLMEENFDGISTQPLVWYDKNPYTTSIGINTPTINSNYIYPSPLRVGQPLHVMWDKSEQARVSMLGLDGRLLYEQKIDMEVGANTFEVPAISAGLYIIKVETPHNYYTQKIPVLN